MSIFAQAMLAAVLVGVVCGIVGVLVVMRRHAFFTVALTHATFPGGVIAALLGVNIALGAGVMGLALVAFMAWISRAPRQGRQVASGIVLTFGYALGMFLHSANPGLPVKVDSFLTGSILALGVGDLVAVGVVLLAVVLVLVVWWKPLLYASFDATGFAASGGRPGAVDVLVLAMIAVTVAVVMPAIGSILAIALLAAPAAAARLCTKRLGWMFVLSVCFGVAAAVAGVLASRMFALAAGGAIALAAVAVYLLALGASALRSRGVRALRLSRLDSHLAPGRASA